MTNRIPDQQNPNQSVFNGERSVNDYLNNRPPENNPYANRGTTYRQDYNAEPVTRDYVYEEQRKKANNEAALSTVLGVGVATLLALGLGALLWPTLFRGNDPQAPTVGPEQTESNIPATEPRISEPNRDTLIIDRTRTQVVPVPVETASPSPQPNSDINISVPGTPPQSLPNGDVMSPGTPPQSLPNGNVTIPPTQSETVPNTNGTILDTNPSPDLDTTTTTPPVINDNTNLQQSDPVAPQAIPPATQPESNLNDNTDAGELVNPGDSRTDR